MKTDTGKKILFILILINLCIGATFVYFIAAISIPEINVDITLKDVTEDQIQFSSHLGIDNANPFGFEMKNIQIRCLTADDTLFTKINFSNARIHPLSESTFSSLHAVSFTGSIPQELICLVTADLDLHIFGMVMKSMPITSTITVTLDNLLQNLSLPKIHIDGQIANLTDEGINMRCTIKVDNPASIQGTIDDITLAVTDHLDQPVGTHLINGGNIKPKEPLILTTHIILPYEVFDARALNIDIAAPCTITIGGITQHITLIATSSAIIPDLAELLNLQNQSLEVSLAAEFKIRFRGLLTTVRLKINNPTNIPLEATNLVCSINGVTGEEEKIIVEQLMMPCMVGSPVSYTHLRAHET